jgi:hypothetical protein
LPVIRDRIAGNKKPVQEWTGLVTTPKDYYLRLAFSSMRRARSLASSESVVLFEQQPELHQLYGRLRLHEPGSELLRLSCSQTSFGFFGDAAATVARTAARARAENFRTLFIVFPFKDFL